MTKVDNLTNILRHAAENGYAAGSFSARYTKLILPIIQAAVNTNSPVIVQLSEKEIIQRRGVRKRVLSGGGGTAAEGSGRAAPRSHQDA